MSLKYLIGLSFVDGPEFLARALRSIRACRNCGSHLIHTIVVDNSESRAAREALDAVEKEFFPSLRVIHPEIPYTHTQTVNLIFKRAEDRAAEVAFIMHTDAVAQPDTIDKLLDLADKLNAEGRKWGVLFTNYDCLACYNMKMVAEVGPWDSVLFPAYFSDNDFYRRMELAGWGKIDSGLPVEHTGSIMHKLDIRRRWISHNVTFDHYHEMWKRKWGGYTHETDKLWTKPYNGELDSLREDVEQRPKP